MKFFEYRNDFNCSSDELFSWHEEPNAFKRLCPYWEPVTLLKNENSIKNGSEIELQVNIGPIPLIWHLVHEDFIQGKQFSDRQLSGPFAYWKHHHLITTLEDGGSQLSDKITYKLPFGFIGNLFGNRFVTEKLHRLFEYRHRITQHDLQARSQLGRKEKMKILISGSSGMVGTDLVSYLENQGHEVVRLVRESGAKGIFWDPEKGILNASDLEGFEAVINLAGENIAGKRWSEKQKEKIKTTRIKTTTLLAETIAKLKNKPKVFVCASAIGFYGNRANETLDETSKAQAGDFLSDTCREWEDACKAARDAGIRVVNTRFGIILSPKGGAMAKLLTPFELGAGGIIGNGKQIMSWIALDDVIYGITYVLQDESISGPVNFTAPKPVSNHEFTKTLGKVLNRPTLFPVPEFAAKLAFGEMADALLLSSQNVQSKKLQVSNFKFAYPDLENALRHLLGK